MDAPIPQEDLDIVMNDIIAIRSNPKTVIERFNIVLYSLKGFKKNEDTVNFIERFIEELEIMEPLPEITKDSFLSMVAQKILEASEKMKVNADKLTDEDIQNIVKPFIKNYDNLNIIYDTHSNASKFLVKVFLKEDVKGKGFDSPNVINLFDSSSNFIGSAGRKCGKTGHYIVLMVDNYEKIEKRDDISEEEYNEFKRLFRMFDLDNDGIITPKQFDEIVNKTGIKTSWPLIVKFQKILFANDPKVGVNLNDFIDAILKFGLFDNDDAIRRIFDLYCDDIENDTLSMLGLKRIANDLETQPHKADMNLLYKFAVDKNSKVTYVEFKDFVKSEVKKGNIKLPKKI